MLTTKHTTQLLPTYAIAFEGAALARQFCASCVQGRVENPGGRAPLQ
jgi:hypothetical protein